MNGLSGDLNAPLHGSLSTREFQIFCRLAQGEAVSSIANSMFLSVKTVSTYRRRVLDKMSLTCNADLTSYATVDRTPVETAYRGARVADQ